MNNDIKAITINGISYIIDKTWEENSIVGIKVIDKQFHVSFPLGYKIEENKDEAYYKKVLQDLYKTVTLTKKIEMNCGLFNNDNNSIPINAYLWILSDYFCNGLYKYNEKKYANELNGKINWKKTFKNIAYISNKKPVYLNFVIEKNKNEASVITELQIYCINKAIDNLIFLGNYKKIRATLKDEDVINNKDYYLNIIKKEYNNTNNDKKQMLLSNMTDIITNTINYSGKIMSYGTIHYQYAWENMIDKLFGIQDGIDEFYPSATWYIKPDYKGIKSSNLREDTIAISEKEKKIYIIDSKYYNNDSRESNFPATSSVQKQITYGEHIKNMKKYRDYSVYNIFVVPAKIDEYIKYIGYSTMKEIEKCKEHEKIYLCLMNTNEVIERFFQTSGTDIELLVNAIDDIKKI